MYLTGLTDDYEHDGRVITQILTSPNQALSAPGVTQLGECYKQLNSSVGDFGAATLTAFTNAIESTSTGDITFTRVNAELRGLEIARDHVAQQIKNSLEAAEFSDQPVAGTLGLTLACGAVIGTASLVAGTS